MIAQDNLTITYIPHTIQDDVIQEYSEDFLTNEFDKIRETIEDTNGVGKLSKADKLHNLISGLGGLFMQYLFQTNLSELFFRGIDRYSR